MPPLIDTLSHVVMDTCDPGSVLPIVKKAGRFGFSACLWLATFPALAGTLADTGAIADEQQGVNWLSVGRTYSENHYSPLPDINARNVGRLGLAWYLDLPLQGSLEATPLAVDGVLYVSGANGWVFAVDAKSGQELWQFDPDLAHHAPDPMGVIFSSNRGVAYWRGKVYVGTVDGRLVALDAKSGRLIWVVQTFEDTVGHRSISGAPRAFNGKVIIGFGGEFGARGYVTAYDAETGKLVWRFYTVPGDPAKGFENAAMAMAAKTWTGQWWKKGGNASVWDSITYDPEFNRVYLGTANGTAPGEKDDTLFVASIVAVNGDTGGYVWHYQETPHDSWDYDAAEQMTLADLTISGKPRKVLMQASKNGFFYVIDRVTGKLVSAEKFSKVTWAERVDLTSGRPIEAPNAHYKPGSAWWVWPSGIGAHDIQSMSFDPLTGWVYIPTMKIGMGALQVVPKDPDDGSGALLAWDPVEQTGRWAVSYPDSLWNGGTLATAGNLVFQGTGRGWFFAYDARTGAKLWSFYAGLGISGAPITYSLNGVQYVTLPVGFGGNVNAIARGANYGWHFNEQPRRLLTFALGQHRLLPTGKPPRFTVEAVDDPSLVIDTKRAAEGAKIYDRLQCWRCHGDNLDNIGSFAPDLRESPLAVNWEAFRSVVHDGSLAAAGMPGFQNVEDTDMRSIYLYVRQRARESVSPRSDAVLGTPPRPRN